MTAAERAARINEVLRRSGTAQRAEHEQRYLKSELAHYGVPVPTVRATVRRVSRENPESSSAEVIHTARDLWSREVHESRLAAVELLVYRVALLSADDLDVVHGLLTQARTWALVDPLAINVVGVLLVRDPAAVTPRLDRWSVDPDFWLRRAALLAMLPALRSGGGDFGRFARYADDMAGEEEFFIRKAIGWVLREAGRTRPEQVADWLERNITRTSGVTVREAVKRLPAADRDRLLAAYRAARST